MPNVIKSGVREMILKVKDFIMKQKQSDFPIIPLEKVNERVAAATAFHPISPEIIGEGELISVIYPDGTLHFYFLPINNNMPTYQNNDVNNTYWNNNGAYYVRSVSQPHLNDLRIDIIRILIIIGCPLYRPISAPLFSQQPQNISGVSRPGSYLITENTPSGFQLKFHNDSWTSTTDLHNFFTRLRGTQWFPFTQSKECEVAPMEISTEDTCPQAEPVKTYTCKCDQDDNKKNKSEKVYCSCEKDANSCGSVTSLSKIKSRKGLCNRHKKAHRTETKQSSITEHRYQNVCATDKSVTTCADQATSCTSEESKTQTCREISTEVDVNSISNKEKKKPRRSKNSRKKKPKPENIYMGESECSSASCCGSATDATYSTDGSNK